MSATPLATLTWAQWQRSRWIILAMPPALLVTGFLTLKARDLGLHEEYYEIAAFMPMLVAIAATAGTVLLIHSDVEKLSVALPLRVLRLPCPTWKLTIGLMLYGICAIALVASVAAILLRYMLSVDLQWWLPPAIAVMALVMLQLWSYGIRDPNPRSAAFSFIIVFAPILFIVTRDVTYRFLTEISPLVFLVVFPALLYALAITTLTINRRGGLPALIPSVFDRKRATARKASIRQPFRSSFRTQLWCEWRQFGWMLPVFVLVILGLYFLGMPLLIALFGSTGVSQDWSGDEPATSIYVSYLSNAQWIINGLNFAAVVSSVLVGAIMFMKAGYWNTKSSHLLAMPVSTRTLARARVVMTFQSAFLSMLILAGLLGAIDYIMMLAGEDLRILHYIGQGYRVFNLNSMNYGGSSGFEVIVFYLGVLFVTMWVAIWSVNAGGALLVYLVTIGPATAVLWFMNNGRERAVHEAEAGIESWSDAGMRVAAAILVGATLWLIYKTLRTRLAGPWALAFAVAFWAVLATAMYLFSEAYTFLDVANFPGEHRWPHPINWAMWLGISMLPIAPFFSHAYLLQRARHQ